MSDVTQLSLEQRVAILEAAMKDVQKKISESTISASQ